MDVLIILFIMLSPLSDCLAQAAEAVKPDIERRALLHDSLMELDHGQELRIGEELRISLNPRLLINPKHGVRNVRVGPWMLINENKQVVGNLAVKPDFDNSTPEQMNMLWRVGELTHETRNIFIASPGLYKVRHAEQAEPFISESGYFRLVDAGGNSDAADKIPEAAPTPAPPQPISPIKFDVRLEQIDRPPGPTAPLESVVLRLIAEEAAVQEQLVSKYRQYWEERSSARPSMELYNEIQRLYTKNSQLDSVVEHMIGVASGNKERLPDSIFRFQWILRVNNNKLSDEFSRFCRDFEARRPNAGKG